MLHLRVGRRWATARTLKHRDGPSQVLLSDKSGSRVLRHGENVRIRLLSADTGNSSALPAEIDLGNVPVALPSSRQGEPEGHAVVARRQCLPGWASRYLLGRCPRLRWAGRGERG
jgi:hypothetical protein